MRGATTQWASAARATPPGPSLNPRRSSAWMESPSSRSLQARPTAWHGRPCHGTGQQALRHLSLSFPLFPLPHTHTHTLMHCYLNIAKYKVGELLVRCCKYRHQNTGGFCSSLPVTHAGASSLLTAVLVALSPAGNVPTVPSIGRWWHGTDPTASTLRKAPSRTCALSSSATAMGLTVKSHHCLSPRPGIRSYNNLYQGLFRKMNDFDFDILCMRLQGTSQLSQTLPSASVQSLGSCAGRGCGYQYIGSAGWTSEKPAV